MHSTDLRWVAYLDTEWSLHEAFGTKFCDDLIVDEKHQISLGILSPDALISDVPSFRLAPGLSFIPPSDRSLSLPLSTLSFPRALTDCNLSWIVILDFAGISPASLVCEGNGELERGSAWTRTKWA